MDILKFVLLRPGLPIQGAEETRAEGPIDTLIPISLSIMYAPCALQVNRSINALNK